MDDALTLGFLPGHSQEIRLVSEHEVFLSHGQIPTLISLMEQLFCSRIRLPVHHFSDRQGNI